MLVCYLLSAGEAINYQAREYENIIELKEATDIDYSDYAARRELVWVATERGSATLASISQHYKDYLCRSNGRISFPNFRGSQSPRRIPHQCSSTGYARQEITLTPNIFKNVVVHHTRPHYNEKCPICGQYYVDETFYLYSMFLHGTSTSQNFTNFFNSRFSFWHQGVVLEFTWCSRLWDCCLLNFEA